MSHRVLGRSNVLPPRASEQKRRELPVSGVSPDDPIEVKPPGTGKPGQLQK